MEKTPRTTQRGTGFQLSDSFSLQLSWSCIFSTGCMIEEERSTIMEVNGGRSSTIELIKSTEKSFKVQLHPFMLVISSHTICSSIPVPSALIAQAQMP